VALVVACLTRGHRWRYREIAQAMAEGIARCGDRPVLADLSMPHKKADVAICYGWKARQRLRLYPHFVYADLGYWQRDSYYRLAVDDWSPEAYVRAGLPPERLQALGVAVQSWKGGREIVVAGSSAKAAADHSLGYMGWEMSAVKRLRALGLPVAYRPKPGDPGARPIEGAEYDTRPLADALASAAGWVTHHSNSAIDALAAGVPVHCALGAAAAFSVPLEQIGSAPRLEGREQFLADVAWLQWSLDEIRRGEAWAHLKDRGLVC
jgi:hypothetical protein